jgi:Ca2+-binding RTX toxin-like protein
LSAIEQITNTLANQSDIEAIHILSHGSPGNLNLGSETISNENLPQLGNKIKQWGKALTKNADILLYGCNVAATEIGLQFIQKLHQLTGANIAASNNKTGNQAAGGDWELEVKIGNIATQPLNVPNYSYTLPTGTPDNKARLVSATPTSTQINVLANDTNTGTGRLNVQSIATPPTNGTATLNDGIYVGGFFTNIGNRIVRLNSDATVDATFNPNANNAVLAIALDSSGNPIVGGLFTTIGGQTRNNIAKLDPTTGLADATFNPNANSNVNTIALDNSGNSYVGGNFTTIGGSPRNFIAKLNPAGVVDATFNPNAGDDVLVITLDSTGNPYVGGLFNTINGGTTRNFIAKLNPTTGVADAFNPNLNGRIEAITFDSSGNPYVGGNFSDIGGTTRGGSAKLDPTTGAANPAFTANASGAVYEITFDSSGNPYLGGNFSAINGILNGGSAKLNPTTGAPDPAYSTNANNLVRAIAFDSSGNPIVGGDFTAIGGITSSIGKLNPATGAAAPTFNPIANAPVYTIAIDPKRDILYTPNANFNGVDTFTYTAKDSSGISAPIPVSVLVNDSPVLDTSGTPILNPQNQGDSASTGTLVSTIIANLGGTKITDPNASAKQGIAINALDTTNGTWQYTINSGTTWTNAPAVSATNALQLASDANTKIRFVPNAGYNGTVANAITFAAWDQITGTNGSTANYTSDRTTNTTSSVFSTATETANITINPVPTITSVTATTPDGTYGIGKNIDITVQFSQIVNVTGTPKVSLAGATPTANYLSGTGSNTLTFRYAVAAGDVSADLDYLSTTALSLSGGTIKNAAIADAILTLPTPAAANSLGANKAIVIDTAAPLAPTIISFSPDTGVVGDSITNTKTLILTGTAEANSKLNILQGGNGIGTATTDAAGKWTFTTPTLPDGTYAFTTTATDAAGNISPASTALNVTVDGIAPLAPTIISFSPDTGVVGDGITNTKTLILTGTAAANSTVNILQGGNGIGTATTDAAGKWTFTTPTLPDGTYAFTTTATDAAGNITPASTALNVTVDGTAPLAPTIISFSPDTGVVGDGITNTKTLILTGTAEANSKLNILQGGNGIGTATTDAAGKWTFTTPTLPDGTYAFTTTATDAAGNISPASTALNVTVDSTAPTTGTPTPTPTTGTPTPTPTTGTPTPTPTTETPTPTPTTGTPTPTPTTGTPTPTPTTGTPTPTPTTGTPTPTPTTGTPTPTPTTGTPTPTPTTGTPTPTPTTGTPTPTPTPTNVLDNSTSPVGVTQNFGTSPEPVNITGSPFNDNFTGTSGADTLSGGDGNDILSGGDGNDTLSGGDGNDILSGGDGNDTINGGDGNDTINTGSGNNLIDGGAGNDVITGGSGNDTITGGTGNNTLTGGTGSDIFSFVPVSGSTLGQNLITDFTTGQDKLQLDAALGFTSVAQVLAALQTTPAGLVLNLGGGGQILLNNISALSANDIILLNAPVTTPTPTPVTTPAPDTDCICDKIEYPNLNQPNQQIDNIINGGSLLIGTPKNDAYFGSNNPNIFDAKEGNDNLFGGDLKDIFNGNQGNDFIDGGKGDDLLFGGKGNDIIIGGFGQDVIFGNQGNDSINGKEDDDLIFGNEGNDFIDGGKGNDNLFGGKGNDIILGSEGNDTLYGQLGDDTLCGGAGNDLVYGGQGNDLIDGGKGNDSIYGDLGNDTLFGCEGDDILFGGAGNNSLVGGLGNDTFVIGFAQGFDIVSDFVKGQDMIGLSGGLSFNQLDITQDNNSALIKLKGSGAVIASLTGVNASLIGVNDFRVI